MVVLPWSVCQIAFLFGIYYFIHAKSNFLLEIRTWMWYRMSYSSKNWKQTSFIENERVHNENVFLKLLICINIWKRHKCMKTEEEDSSFSLDGEFIFTKAAKEETLQRIHNIVPIETFHGKKNHFIFKKNLHHTQHWKFIQSSHFTLRLSQQLKPTWKSKYTPIFTQWRSVMLCYFSNYRVEKGVCDWASTNESFNVKLSPHSEKHSISKSIPLLFKVSTILFLLPAFRLFIVLSALPQGITAWLKCVTVLAWSC